MKTASDRNNSLKEIAMIGTYPPPSGGVSIHIKALGKFIMEKGLHCTFFNTGPTKNIAEPNLVNVFSLKDLFVKLFKSRASILHVHGGIELYKKLIVFFVLRIVTPKKYVITIHSGGLIEDLQKKSFLQKKIFSLLLDGADQIICVSERLKKTVTALNIRPDKCHVIPAFAVNEDLTQVSLPDELEAFLQKHRPILSCVGYCFAQYYGFELAIQAVWELRRRYPDIGLVIMGGNTKDEEFTALKSSFSEQELQGVHFTGDIRHKPVLSIISQSDIFLRPTYHDGDANSVREAIAMNVPAIVSDTEIRPAEAILFKKGSVADLVDRILSCLKIPQERPAKPARIKDTRNLEAVLKIYCRAESQGYKRYDFGGSNVCKS